MANILCLETATNACSVALKVGENVYARHVIAPRKHASLLLPMIDSLLKEAGIDKLDVSLVAFGAGPGSFLGARLAVGVAQGLAFGWNIPVVPISTLQIIAQAACEQIDCDFVLSGWDARMGDVYWGLYQRDSNGLMSPVQEDRLSRPQEVTALQIDQTLCAAGNAWFVYADELVPELSERIKNHVVDCYPAATAMIPIAQYLLENGLILDPNKAFPNYLRDNVTG